MGNPEQIGIAHYSFVITEHPPVGADPRVCPPQTPNLNHPLPIPYTPNLYGSFPHPMQQTIYSGRHGGLPLHLKMIAPNFAMHAGTIVTAMLRKCQSMPFGVQKH